jgi:retinol dehydrogenase-12
MEDSLKGRHFVVTGANTGIGRVTAVELAKREATVVLAARSEEKTRPVLDEIRAAGGDVSFLRLDLASLEDTARAAKELLASPAPLHVLINNAGLAGTPGLTQDGFELAFGTNHLGHYLFTRLLLPKLRAASPARIVNVSSKSHYRAHGIDWEALRKRTASTTGLPEYEVSKLANVLFTKELARGQAGEGVRSYALHPGVVASDAWRRVPWPIRPLIKLFMISNDEGARTTLHCATSDDVAAEDGLYYDECRVKKPNPLAEDAALAKELWERSEAWVKPYLVG